VTDTSPTNQQRVLRRVVQAEPLYGMVVRLLFDDGTQKAIDLDWYLRGPVFEQIRQDPEIFRAVAVDDELGTLVWPSGADLDTQVLYYDNLYPAEWEMEGLSATDAAARKRQTIVNAGASDGPIGTKSRRATKVQYPPRTAPSDSVISVLRRRGHVITLRQDPVALLLPLEREDIDFESVSDFWALFGKSSFRKTLRRLLTARGGLVDIDSLASVAGKSATQYVAFLEELAVAEVKGRQARLTRHVDNIGPTLEAYLAHLCRAELAGTAEWGVRLEHVSHGGDFDVLAWLDPTLVYVEAKSSSPASLSESELRHFLQRSVELAPDLAILLIDTTDDLTPLLDRLTEIMVPVVRRSSGIGDESWRPDRNFVRPVEGYPGVNHGYFRIYLTHSDPSIVTQLRRCLLHYHARVKGHSMWGGPPVDFVTDWVGQEH
jgi:hypothetical protein